jgi:hypothetical protein
LPIWFEGLQVSSGESGRQLYQANILLICANPDLNWSSNTDRLFGSQNVVEACQQVRSMTCGEAWRT